MGRPLEDTIDDIKKQIEEINRRLDRIEKKANAHSHPHYIPLSERRM